MARQENQVRVETVLRLCCLPRSKRNGHILHRSIIAICCIMQYVCKVVNVFLVSVLFSQA